MLKKINFPEIEKEKKPSEIATKISQCLAKRVAKLQIIVDKFEQASKLNEHQSQTLT